MRFIFPGKPLICLALNGGLNWFRVAFVSTARRPLIQLDFCAVLLNRGYLPTTYDVYLLAGFSGFCVEFGLSRFEAAKEFGPSHTALLRINIDKWGRNSFLGKIYGV